jgi:Xaa-Pro aminopeptidase
LIERLAMRGLDGALITDARDIMYFTGAALGASAPGCLLVRRDGSSVLVCGESETAHQVDALHAYSWHTGGTVHLDLWSRLSERAGSVLNVGRERLGMQRESALAQVLAGLANVTWSTIDAEIIDIERTKDELALAGVRGAVQANLGAYEAVGEAITPGVRELDVFAAGWCGATRCARGRVVHDGDYRSGEIGGPARDRRIEAGELYIVDAWTNRAGYWSDLSRVFPVSGSTTEHQRELLEHVASIHERVRPLLRPGTTGDELWRSMDAMLREHPALATSGLVHHGGHGIGVRIHEPPDINPGVTDTLRVGDVICLEPGAYTKAARAGGRIEEMYLITEHGAECLSCGPG